MTGQYQSSAHKTDKRHDFFWHHIDIIKALGNQ